MTTYTVTTSIHIDAVSPARTGGDVYNINGGTLTIDQDTRYGLGGGAVFSLGNITLNSSSGGRVTVDARAVRLIPYNTGAGTVPAAGTVITRGAATGKLIGVWSSINTAPLAAGASMPASGFIKVKQASGAYTAGTLTGISATATGADVAGWIELVGDEGGTITVPRLGTFEMLGQWFAVGSTSGSNATTYQLPTSGSAQYFPGVWVETATAGSFEFYPCAGSLVAAGSVATDAVRGKVCWISTAGVLRFGSDGTNTVGYVPPAGRAIRLPNIIAANCTTAARGTNALPNATLATRYDFTTTGGGVINIDKACLAWYPSFAQAYSVTLTNTGLLEQVNISEIASPLNWSQVGVGQAAAQAQFALQASLCFAGGTFTDCVWSTASLAASGRYAWSLTDMAGINFVRGRSFSFVLRANATTGNATLTRCANMTFTDPVVGGGRVLLTTCTNVTATNTTYFDNITGTTGTANPMSVFDVGSNTNGFKADGMSFGGVANVQCYNALVNVAAAGCANIKLRNVGTYVAPLNLGSVNAASHLFTLAAGAAAKNMKVQRCYVSNTRNSLYSMDNSSKGVSIENTFGDAADAPVTPGLNVTQRALGMTHPLTAQTACYGTHWLDMHTSTTQGRIAVLMNEPTAETASQVALTAGAAFTSAGGLYMPTIGQSATFEMPDWLIGHTSFQNAAAVMAGGTIGNYTLEYQIDTGGGYGAWKALTGANLSAEAGINAQTGIKLKLRITTSVANTLAITSLYVLTNSTTTSQAYQYPLDVGTVTVTNLAAGSRVKATKVSDGTVLVNAAETAGVVTFQTDQLVPLNIEVRKASAAPFFQPWVTQLTPVADTNVSATALQVRDDL
jgi:hypothetical protein